MGRAVPCLTALVALAVLCRSQSSDETALLQQDVSRSFGGALYASPDDAKLEAQAVEAGLLETGAVTAVDKVDNEQGAQFVVALPTLTTSMGVLVALGLFLSSMAFYGWMKTEKTQGPPRPRYGCKASGCCGSILLILGLIFVVIKIVLAVYAGPDAIAPSTVEAAPPLVIEVQSQSPFTPAEINDDPSVHGVFMAGMHTVMGEDTHLYGLEAVELDDEALGKRSLSTLSGEREGLFDVILRFNVRRTASQWALPATEKLQVDLVDALKEAASEVVKHESDTAATAVKADVLERIRKIAEGTLVALSGRTEAHLKTQYASFRCSAGLHVTNDIKDAVKGVINVKEANVTQLADDYVDKVMAEFGLEAHLSRCNALSQPKDMRICITKEKGWIVSHSTKPVAVPEGVSAEKHLCRMAHTLKCNLMSNKKKMFDIVNEYSHGFALDEKKTMQDIECIPAGISCGAHDEGRCEDVSA